MNDVKKEVINGVVDVAKEGVNNLLILVMGAIFSLILWIFYSSFKDLLKMEMRNQALLIEIKQTQKTILYKCNGRKYDDRY